MTVLIFMLLGSTAALADAQSECRDWHNEVIRRDPGASGPIAYGNKGDLDRAIVDFNEAIVAIANSWREQAYAYMPL
jgi:hypothetical protein